MDVPAGAASTAVALIYMVNMTSDGGYALEPELAGGN